MFLIDGCPCLGTTIPLKIVSAIRLLYNGIRIVVPIILIIIGMIDMAKAVSAKDESEIKKAQTLLVKRGIAAALVFLMLSLVTLVVTSTSPKGEEEMNCVKCILGDGETSTKTSTASVSFNETSLDLKVGETKTIYLNTWTDDGKDKKVSFYQSQNGIATFIVNQESSGRYKITVRAIGVGRVVYSAVLDSNKSVNQQININVTNNSNTYISKVEFSTKTLNLGVGETKTIKLQVSPSNVTSNSISFNASSDEYADIKTSYVGSGTYEITIASKKAGTFTYEAKSNDGLLKKDVLTVKITTQVNLTTKTSKTIVFSSTNATYLFPISDSSGQELTNWHIEKINGDNDESIIDTSKFEVTKSKEGSYSAKLAVNKSKYGRTKYRIYVENNKNAQGKYIDIEVLRYNTDIEIKGPAVIVNVEGFKEKEKAICNNDNFSIENVGGEYSSTGPTIRDMEFAKAKSGYYSCRFLFYKVTIDFNVRLKVENSNRTIASSKDLKMNKANSLFEYSIIPTLIKDHDLKDYYLDNFYYIGDTIGDLNISTATNRYGSCSGLKYEGVLTLPAYDSMVTSCSDFRVVFQWASAGRNNIFSKKLKDKKEPYSKNGKLVLDCKLEYEFEDVKSSDCNKRPSLSRLFVYYYKKI